MYDIMHIVTFLKFYIREKIMDGNKTDRRRKKIIDALEKQGKVKITALSKELGVSLVTVRSDLKFLEQRGMLQCVTGGAVQSRADAARAKWVYSTNLLSPAKAEVAKKAMELFSDGQTVMINSGATTRLLAREFHCINNIKMVTNSVIIAQEIAGLHNVHLTLLGGSINPQFLFSNGMDTVLQLEKYKADIAVLSVDGIDLKNGITTYHEEEGEINRIMIRNSFKTVIVADSSKLGKTSFAKFADIKDIDVLVTTQDADMEIVSALREAGVKVIM